MIKVVAMRDLISSSKVFFVLWNGKAENEISKNSKVRNKKAEGESK